MPDFLADFAARRFSSLQKGKSPGRIIQSSNLKKAKHISADWPDQKAWFTKSGAFASLTLLVLDGRNRAIVIAEPLASVIAAIRTTSVHWWSNLPQNTQNSVLVDPVFVVLQFALCDWRSCTQHSFYVELRNGFRELTAFAQS